MLVTFCDLFWISFILLLNVSKISCSFVFRFDIKSNDFCCQSYDNGRLKNLELVKFTMIYVIFLYNISWFISYLPLVTIMNPRDLLWKKNEIWSRLSYIISDKTHWFLTVKLIGALPFYVNHTPSTIVLDHTYSENLCMHPLSFAPKFLV